ncbi:MAG: STAS domain-containing protein [Flavobacteriaceae bacterium]|nr:STAS domain-containing protein [Flavobacteriaceae bacterium]
MALLIENQQNVFYIKGVIDESNSEILKLYMMVQFTNHSIITIDISNVSRIDRHGVNALTSLYQNALKREKDFKIVGYGCKDIYDEFLLSA